MFFLLHYWSLLLVQYSHQNHFANSKVTRVSLLSFRGQEVKPHAFRCITLHTCSTIQNPSLSLSPCSLYLLSSACNRSIGLLQFSSNQTGINILNQAQKSSNMSSVFEESLALLVCPVTLCVVLYCIVIIVYSLNTV